MSRPGRLGVSIAASVVLHVVALGVIVHRRLPLRPAFVPIPVSLVGRPGGGPGGAGEAPAAAPPSTAAPAPPREPATVAERPSASRPRRRVVRATPAPSPEPAAPETGSTGGGGGAAPSPGGAPGAGGGGEGGGGDGSGGARVAYGTNPLPPYPLVARRLGKEGVVVLEVLVAPDGRAAEVRVIRSCGFPPLDESALTTVRDRWRFIPARRGGEAVESRVTVPIRFRLEDVSG